MLKKNNLSLQIMESRKRHTLTLEERVQIIKMVEENNMSTRKLAELFECGRTQVNDILKKKEQILKDWNENLHSSVKRRKSGKYDNVNIALLEWFKCARAHRLALSGPILKEQALKIAQDLGCTEFCASNGWFNKFCIRNNIQFRAMSGVSRNVRPLSRQDWIERIPQLLKDYNLQNVFTVSETGLFFRALPTKNMTLKADKCTTGNMSNERLTVSFCVSAGGEKLAPLVIGRVIDNPKSLTDINDETVTVHYRQNKKSWMTAELFNEWLKHLNKKLRQCNRKILLFVTNTPCHKVLELFSNVDLRFLSASGTAAGMSHFQPLDQDVIQTFKLSYRKRVLKHVVARLNDASSASELAKSITIGLAIEWIGAAWQDVKAETIVKCFANCGFTSNLNSNIDAIIDNTQLHTELEALCHVAHVDFSKEAHMEDNKLECYDKLRGRDGELLETSLLNGKLCFS